jgi:hypothetical protein
MFFTRASQVLLWIMGVALVIVSIVAAVAVSGDAGLVVFIACLVLSFAVLCVFGIFVELANNLLDIKNMLENGEANLSANTFENSKFGTMVSGYEAENSKQKRETIGIAENHQKFKEYKAMEEKERTQPTVELLFEVGDTVTFTGGLVYASPTAENSTSVKEKESVCEVTATAANGLHPYRCFSQDDGGVYGWVNGSSLRK